MSRWRRPGPVSPASGGMSLDPCLRKRCPDLASLHAPTLRVIPCRDSAISVQTVCRGSSSSTSLINYGLIIILCEKRLLVREREPKIQDKTQGSKTYYLFTHNSITTARLFPRPDMPGKYKRHPHQSRLGLYHFRPSHPRSSNHLPTDRLSTQPSFPASSRHHTDTGNTALHETTPGYLAVQSRHPTAANPRRRPCPAGPSCGRPRDPRLLRCMYVVQCLRSGKPDEKELRSVSPAGWDCFGGV